MIFLLDNDEQITGILSNENEQACPYVDDKLIEDLDTGAQTFEFSVPANHPDAARIDEKGFIATTGFKDEYLQFEIASIEEEHTRDGLYKRVYCEFAWSELNGHIVRPFNLPAASAQTVATHALAGTRWQPGTIEFFGNADFSSDDYPTALKVLQDVKDTFEADIRFRVEFTNNRISGRFVDIVNRRGINNGKIISFGKNLVSAKRIYDRTNVATALIGLGKGDTGGRRMTFTTTVWKKSNGDPVDKPSGQDWVGDEEALKIWGIDGRHITRVFEYDTTNPTVLLQETWKELQRLKNGVYQYEAEAAMLDRIGFDWEQSNIGDDVLIQDHLFEPPLMLNARIIKLERSKTDPTQNKATFGDYLPAISKAIDVSAIQSEILKNSTKWEQGAEGGGAPLIRSDTPPSNTGAIWVHPATGTRPFDVIYTYNPDTGKWEVTAPINPGDIQAETQIIKQPTEPGHLEGRLWMNTSKIPNEIFRSEGGKWIKVTPTEPGDIGAETPGGAEGKAAVAQWRAYLKAVETHYNEMLKRADPVLNNNLYYTADRYNDVLNAKNALVNTYYPNIKSAVENAIRDGILLQSELDLIDLRKQQYELGTANLGNAIEAANQDAGGLRVGTITGITLQVANAGISNEGAASNDVRIWAGTGFSSRGAAPFRVTQSGEVTASNINITGGTINIGNSATIGNALYLGSLSSYEYKYVYFNNNARIYSDGYGLEVEGSRLTISTGGGAELFTDGPTMYLYGSVLEIGANLSYFTGQLETRGTARIYGDFTIHNNNTGKYMRYIQAYGYWQTNNVETGFCGIGGLMNGATSSSFVGVGVNFRVQKTYVPSSIALSGTSHNLSSSTQVQTTDISGHGFWLYLIQGANTNAYRYWRGTYTA